MHSCSAAASRFGRQCYRLLRGVGLRVGQRSPAGSRCAAPALPDVRPDSQRAEPPQRTASACLPPSFSPRHFPGCLQGSFDRPLTLPVPQHLTVYSPSPFPSALRLPPCPHPFGVLVGQRVRRPSNHRGLDLGAPGGADPRGQPVIEVVVVGFHPRVLSVSDFLSCSVLQVSFVC